VGVNKTATTFSQPASRSPPPPLIPKKEEHREIGHPSIPHREGERERKDKKEEKCIKSVVMPIYKKNRAKQYKKKTFQVTACA
jgi:hypothetical protein